MPNLDGKNSTEPHKNSKKHVFLTNPKNIEKHAGAGGGGGLTPKHSKTRVLGSASDQKHWKIFLPSSMPKATLLVLI